MNVLCKLKYSSAQVLFTGSPSYLGTAIARPLQHISGSLKAGFCWNSVSICEQQILKVACHCPKKKKKKNLKPFKLIINLFVYQPFPQIELASLHTLSEQESEVYRSD